MNTIFCTVVVDHILLLSLSLVIKVGNLGCALFSFNMF